MFIFLKSKKGPHFKGRGYILSFLFHWAFMGIIFIVFCQSKRLVNSSFLSQEFSVRLFFEDNSLFKPMKKNKDESVLKIGAPQTTFQKHKKTRKVSEAQFFSKNKTSKTSSENFRIQEELMRQKNLGKIDSEGVKDSPTPFFKAPQLRSLKKISYPHEAIRYCQEGEVILLLTIDQQGKVQEIVVRQRSGWESLDKVAIDYARTLIFTPALKNGMPIISVMEMTFPFRLEERNN